MAQSIRVLVCGGRTFNDAALLDSTLSKIHSERVFNSVIYGGARGADSLAGWWAFHKKIPTVVFPVDWKLYAESAGSIRNKRMLSDGRPQLVVAFPGGPGTAHMVKIAREVKLEVICV